MRAALVAILLLFAASASADAVGPEDTSVVCPNGSYRTTHHCGTVCQVRPCTTDADCRGGLVCIEARLCVNSEPYCGRGGSSYDRVHGDCSRPCSAGSCRTLRACGMATPAVDSGTPSDGGGPSVVTYGCGCRTSGSEAGAPWLLALGLWLVARRRRRSSLRVD